MPDSPVRLQLEIRGIVQGVGFRPFIYALATRLGLTGFVRNGSSGVTLQIQGPSPSVRAFQTELENKPPPLAHIGRITATGLPVRTERVFLIQESHATTGRGTPVSPDMATCDQCLAELFDPADRRYGYPFINCTNCGPRFTILRDVPYDRARTTMAPFVMCPECQREYDDPANRRFHAQPNACPACGPHVWLVTGEDCRSEVAFRGPLESTPRQTAAIEAARHCLAEGLIVAIKGLGGFHLACDANNNDAVRTLRERKGRQEKPLALMVRDLATARTLAHITDAEAARLASCQRPIVLLHRLRRPGQGGAGQGEPENEGANTPCLSDLVAPGNASLGIMLPYTPLHHLIVGDKPLVMTSGNLSEEPIVRENLQAYRQLTPLADAFLLHDRQIHTVCDDSVVQLVEGGELPIRRSRGYAPMPLSLASLSIPKPARSILAVGGELKATFCLTRDDEAYLSQHIGDMGNLETLAALEREVDHFCDLFQTQPQQVVCDMHPGYLSSRWASQFAQATDLPLTKVQHHHAHIGAVMAEHGCNHSGQVIGISFDGTGYGTDEAIWGGEFLTATYTSFTRIAHLKYVPLPGGDASIRRPYRAALAHLWAARISWDERLPCVAACPPAERRILRQQFEQNLRVVPTSSMGRLFDAVAAIAGVRQTVDYEAQAAMELEALCNAPSGLQQPYQQQGSEQELPVPERGYRFVILPGEPLQIDPTPLLEQIVADQLAGMPASIIGAKFHEAVARMTCDLCQQIRGSTRWSTVALSGGVFQNRLLLRMTRSLLRTASFKVLDHKKVPPNDGGLALGQAAIAASRLAGP
jgi:hydrogenase maturation protein HypF